MPPEIPSRCPSTAAGAIEACGDYEEPAPPNPGEIEADRRRARRRTIILAVSSALLLAIVATISASGIFSGGGGSEGKAVGPLLPSFNESTVRQYCQLTDFPHTCQSTVSRASFPIDDDPKVFLLFLVNQTIEAVDGMYNYSSILKNGIDGRDRWAIIDCEELLQRTLVELGDSQCRIQSVEMGDLSYNLRDIRLSLSAVVAYEQTCAEGFGDRTVEILPMMKNAIEQTRNILDVVSRIPADEWTRGGKGRRLMGVDGGGLTWHVAAEKPDVVVAQDGSGDYGTIGVALKAVAGKEREGRLVIYVKEGLYKENVKLTAEMNYITMYGDGPNKTLVTGTKGYGDGISMYGTATFAVSGTAFMAREMGFQNNAGPRKGPSVALRVESDLSVFYNCWIDGYQNTLFAHTHRQFYRDCTISGTVDIISGDAAAMFQNCKISVKKPFVAQQNSVMAQARIDQHEPTGFVLQNCTILAAEDLSPVTTYLGRPGNERSRAVVMQSTIDNLIGPQGWGPLGPGSEWDKTVYFAEFGNTGSGSGLNERVTWQGFHVLADVADVATFTAGAFIQGKTWLNMTGAPYYTGLL